MSLLALVLFVSVSAPDIPAGESSREELDLSHLCATTPEIIAPFADTPEAHAQARTASAIVLASAGRQNAEGETAAPARSVENVASRYEPSDFPCRLDRRGIAAPGQ